MSRFLRLAVLLLGLAAPCAASALPAGVVPLRGANAPREDLRQDFTLVRTPILAAHRTSPGPVSDQRPLVLTRSGGGAETETVILTSRDGRYDRVSDAAPAPAHVPLQGALLFASSPDGAEPRWFLCAPDGGAS